LKTEVVVHCARLKTLLKLNPKLNQVKIKFKQKLSIETHSTFA